MSSCGTLLLGIAASNANNPSCRQIEAYLVDMPSNVSGTKLVPFDVRDRYLPMLRHQFYINEHKI